jgi:predicted AAA+ superfamily ATPase
MDVVEFLKEEKFLMEEMFSRIARETRRNVFSQLGKSNLSIVYGLRGTGKTTLIAQKYFEIEENEEKGIRRLAIHGEHLNLAGYKIKDLIPSLKYILSEGYLFIDEITSIKNWPVEIKILSDMYPKLKIIVTGSSAVDLQEARKILARRAVFINLKPLTLNEFLRIKYKTEIIPFDPFAEDKLTNALRTELDAREKLKDIEKIIIEYKRMNLPYLIESPTSTLLDVIERVIYEDIGGAGSFSEDVLNKFKPLLKLLALSEKISYDSLSRDVGIGKGTVIKMLDYLSKANLIKPIYPYSKGKGKVRKEPKYLFTSPIIRDVLLDLIGEKESGRGLIREDLFAINIEREELFYLPKGPDYVWRNYLFEIGGASKGREQFKDLEVLENKLNFSGKYIIHEGLQISSGEVFRLPFYVFLSYF